MIKKQMIRIVFIFLLLFMVGCERETAVPPTQMDTGADVATQEVSVDAEPTEIPPEVPTDTPAPTPTPPNPRRGDYRNHPSGGCARSIG